MVSEGSQGEESIRDLLQQLLLGLAALRVHNITHRDVKPGNALLRLAAAPDGGTGRMHLRLIDFGSAVDRYSVERLYGEGPSSEEQTATYAPPEALLSRSPIVLPSTLKNRN